MSTETGESGPRSETDKKPEPKARQLQELLDDPESKLPEKLRVLFVAALKDHPVLAAVRFETFKPTNEHDAGGLYKTEDDGSGTPMPVIYISEGEAEALRPLMQSRRRAMEINARQLEIEPEQLTPELLHLFIIAHELGHSKDFLVNYLQNPELKPMEAAEEMWMHRRNVLGTLPVRGYDPSMLNHLLTQFMKDLPEAVQKWPEIKDHPRFAEMKTLDDLRGIQEEEYREAPPELYADKFAAELIKKNMEALGFSGLGSK